MTFSPLSLKDSVIITVRQKYMSHLTPILADTSMFVLEKRTNLPHSEEKIDVISNKQVRLFDSHYST